MFLLDVLKKVFALLALMSAPLAAGAQDRGYYTDFMYENYVGDEGRRPAVLPGSMEYSLPKEKKKPKYDTIGYVDVGVGLSQLGEYSVKPGSNDSLGGLKMDKNRSAGYGVKFGFDAIGKLVGVEIDLEGSGQNGAEPGGVQAQSFQSELGEISEATYYDAEGAEQKTEALAATPVLQGYRQDVKFFQGGLNLVLNLGGSSSMINPFVGVGGGVARVRLVNKGIVNTREVEKVDNYDCSVAGTDKTACETPGVWTPEVTGVSASCGDGSNQNPSSASDCTDSTSYDPGSTGTPASCSISSASNSEPDCLAATLGTWDVKDQKDSWSQSTYEFPAEEGASVGYTRAVAGLAFRIGPYANLLLSGSYTRYSDPGFTSMTLEKLERKQGSLGLRMNF
jgi:hypothetical protein